MAGEGRGRALAGRVRVRGGSGRGGGWELGEVERVEEAGQVGQEQEEAPEGERRGGGEREMCVCGGGLDVDKGKGEVTGW